MIKKQCPNGHVYDQSIYGDTCPLCPPPSAAGGSAPVNATMAAADDFSAPHTRVANPGGGKTSVFPGGGGIAGGRVDPTGDTTVSSPLRKPQPQPAPVQPQSSPRTVIRPGRAGAMPLAGAAAKNAVEGRKLVGFLVTYNRTPMGKAFNIYEGRNFIGRDADCDISVPDDTQMSGKHMLIRFLTGDGKFRFRDEMSSNGTYVNKQLLDEGELQNYDIIRVGSTLFIFIAIPQI